VKEKARSREGCGKGEEKKRHVVSCESRSSILKAGTGDRLRGGGKEGRKRQAARCLVQRGRKIHFHLGAGEVALDLLKSDHVPEGKSISSSTTGRAKKKGKSPRRDGRGKDRPWDHARKEGGLCS